MGTPPTKLDGEKDVPKPHFKQDNKDLAMVNLNFKVISCIINDLTCSELHKVMKLLVPRKMQIYLQVTHEGTSEIRNNNINILTRDFDSNRLMPNESIDDFLERFKGQQHSITWESDHLL